MATKPTGWIFADDAPKPEPEEKFPLTIEPYMLMTTDDQWKNYADENIYDFEKRLRDFLKYMSERKQYRYVNTRRFTYAMIYERLYGMQPKRLNSYAANSHRAILAYYSSRIIKDTNIGGKRKRVVYVLAYSRLKKRPWGLKLRLEWFLEHQDEVCPGMMRLMKKRLEVGHARNPKTEQNMERRSEIARQRYRERYNTPEYRAHLKDRHNGS